MCVRWLPRHCANSTSSSSTTAAATSPRNPTPSASAGARVISNSSNVGFGAAVNQGIRDSVTPFVATLNDDAVAHPECFARLLVEMDEHYETGMCAPQIRLAGTDQLDSAGMLLARDGSSRQRGHGESPAAYDRRRQVMLPSGCAAVYRRDMLDEIGLFDESFFLYCEDTDLGLRARWKLWECVYVPEGRGGASLFANRRRGFGIEGLLR